MSSTHSMVLLTIFIMSSYPHEPRCSLNLSSDTTVAVLSFLHFELRQFTTFVQSKLQEKQINKLKEKEKKEDNTISHHVTRNNYNIHNTFWTKDIFINNHQSTMDHPTMDSYITYSMTYKTRHTWNTAEEYGNTSWQHPTRHLKAPDSPANPEIHSVWSER